jgi:Fe-S-cluster-containing dehydrogenase component
MGVTRRDFLKASGGGALLAATASEAEARPVKEPPPNAVGMLYDATICIGCKACMVGCKEANDMPVDSELESPIWDTPSDLSPKTLNIIKVYRDGDASAKDREIDGFSFVKRHCMHCVDPVCVSVCPVTALIKDAETGVVSYDPDTCIGCRYCVYACPFSIPKFDYEKALLGEIHKCQFCDHRLSEGKLPACVEHCPTGASLFGTREEILVEAKRRLALEPGAEYEYPLGDLASPHYYPGTVGNYQPVVYGETEGGGTQVMMLAGVPFDKLGLPELPDEASGRETENIQHTLYQGLIAPILLFAGLSFAARKTLKDHSAEDEEADQDNKQ